MAKESYSRMIKARIGRVTASAKADNYFPLVGQTVRIDAVTRWGQSSEWETQDGSGETMSSAGALTLQKDSKSILVTGAGELRQKFIARNSLFSAELVKTVYAISPQTLPYFDVSADEVVRVGEPGTILVRPEHGYPASRARTVTARIYKENAVSHPVRTLPFVESPTSEVYPVSFTFSEISDRGIYDVEVDVTDTETGITLTKRINKLITVTPALCPKPSDTAAGYEVVSNYQGYTTYIAPPKMQTFEIRLWRNVGGSGLNYAEMIIPSGNPQNAHWYSADISGLPAGTTLCLKRDPQEKESNYPMRLFIHGNKDHTVTNENGTPNFTYEAPLVITHDDEGVFDWGWRAYGAFVPMNNIRNVVFDGRGYHNTGMYFHVFEEGMFSDSCFFVNNGTSDIELFGVEIYGAGFAGIAAKTDPNPNNPFYWRENGWEMHLKIHHCRFRYTVGEGVYIGYFNSQTLTGNNASGVAVSYHAHLIRGLRLYRCEWENNGYDSIQINNTVDAELCYCHIRGSAYRREPNQDSVFSCTFDGKIYNCMAEDSYGVVGVVAPLMGDLEIFNNILIGAKGANGLMTAYWSESLNENVHPDDTGHVGDRFKWHIYNNIIKAAKPLFQFGDVTFSNFRAWDNVFLYEDGDDEGQLTGSFSGSGNVMMKADQNYAEIDSALKIADSGNNNFQPASNSLLVTAGKVGRSTYDMRGYKNWYNSNFWAGPLMGIVKDTSVADESLVLAGIQLNDGADYTYAKEVSVRFLLNGAATRYRIGESADLSAAVWQPLTGTATGYAVSDGYAQKTVYAQVANTITESSVVSAVIDYRREPVTASLLINDGAGNTACREVSVKFVVAGVYDSLRYMLSEDDTFAGCDYADYVAGDVITFTLSEGSGVKKLYGRIKSDDGQEVAVQSTIRITAWGIKLATGYIFAELGFDAGTGLNKFFLAGGTRDVKDVTGADAGQVALTLNKINSDEMAGSPTGDNSGIYPDVWISHRNYIVSETADQTERFLKFLSVPNGNYKVKIYCNGNHYNANKITETTNTFFKCNGQQVLAADQVESFINNFHDYIIFEGVRVTDGTLTLTCWGTVAYPRIPINIVEIEKI